MNIIDWKSLSNDQKNKLIAIHIFDQKEGIDFGEFPDGHKWKMSDDGIDYFAYSTDYHNGPVCKVCGYTFCEHCTPNGYDTPCEVSVDNYLSELYTIDIINKLLDKNVSITLDYTNSNNTKSCIIHLNNLSSLTLQIPSRIVTDFKQINDAIVELYLLINPNIKFG